MYQYIPILLLPYLTTTLPSAGEAPCTNPPCGPFTIHVRAPGSVNDGQSITAQDSNFFVGIPTEAASCPNPNVCTLPTNVTAISVTGNGTAQMASLSPQRIFVNGTDGTLSYGSSDRSVEAASGSENIMTGFNFSSTQPTTSPNEGNITFNPLPYRGFAGFYLCSAPGMPQAVKKIYTTEGAQCARVEMGAALYSDDAYGAYEYS